MTPNEPPTAPTWQELNEFIRSQSKEDRDLLDRWFTLASKVLGLVVIVTGLVIGVVGWKTVSDARSLALEAAKTEASVQARIQVGELLKSDPFLKGVTLEAQKLLKGGSFNDAILAATPNKVCRAVRGGNTPTNQTLGTGWYAATPVPLAWTSEKCRQFAQSLTGEVYVLGCLDGESFEWGEGNRVNEPTTPAGLIPVKNTCNWKLK